MTRHFIAGLLWFVAVSSLVSFVETLLGNPRQFGTIVGIMVGGVIMFDPIGTIWATPNTLSFDTPRRRIVRHGPRGASRS